jgi:hypothetical protein
MESSIKNPAAYSRDLLMVSLSKFYSTKSHMHDIIPIITGKSTLSLRLLDWFVTNYSKKTSTNIAKVVDNNIIHFNVYLSYRSQLKAYSKQQFDPFRRRDRITFFYEKEKSIETTIGQLNFFRWVIQNDILTHIQENIAEIEGDMIMVQKKVVESTVGSVESTESTESVESTVGSVGSVASASTDVARATKKGKKRIELSKSFVKNMNRFEGSRTIAFS